jgi:hypothetical protein
MSGNHEINVDRISKVAEKVAEKLGPLVGDVVFLGGAVIGFYLKDEFKDDLRVTNDVDFIVEITTYIDMTELEGKLEARGFVRLPEDAM